MTFAVLVSSSLPAGVRGAVCRWMIEVQPGAFVGTMSKRVRDEVWDLVRQWVNENQPGPYAALVESADSEQGFVFRTAGDDAYEVVDHLGVQLVTRRHKHASASRLTGLPHPDW